MRICLISREYPPDTGWGGIGAYTYQHARALKELGHDVEVVSLCKKEATADISVSQCQDDPLFVPVHRAAWGPLLEELSTVWISIPYTHFLLKSASALWRKFMERHRQKPFDIVEAPEHLAEGIFPALTAVCPLLLRLHTPHSKFIAERYHNLTASFDQELVAILERTAMLEADFLSSPSRDLASYVSSDTAIDSCEIHFVPNPVDCRKFTPEGPRAIPESSDLTVFFAGRLEERKGIHYLVEAIPQILAEIPQLRFVIVGADTNTGPGKSSVLAALKQKLEEASATSKVEFISHVPLDQMPAHYRCADLCVVPSLYENAPYTVLEALASGKPVVTTSAGGSKEYILEGKTGCVVPPRDASALAQAIIRILKDEKLRSEMGRNARQQALNNYDKSIVVKNVLETYEATIEKHKQKQGSQLYRRSPELVLSEFISLIYAYHQNLCDLIYRHSLAYRLKYWFTLACKRPKLCAAKLLLQALKAVNATFSFAPRKLEEMQQQVQAQISAREAEKEKLILEKLLADTLASRSP